jgi:hypothetical protein
MPILRFRSLTALADEFKVLCPYCDWGCQYCGYAQLKPCPSYDPLNLIPPPKNNFRFKVIAPKILQVFWFETPVGFITTPITPIQYEVLNKMIPEIKITD